jgi:hypothetical protein
LMRVNDSRFQAERNAPFAEDCGAISRGGENLVQ